MLLLVVKRLANLQFKAVKKKKNSSKSTANLSIHQNVFRNCSLKIAPSKKYIFEIAFSKNTFQKVAPLKNAFQKILKFEFANLGIKKSFYFSYIFCLLRENFSNITVKEKNASYFSL